MRYGSCAGTPDFAGSSSGMKTSRMRSVVQGSSWSMSVGTRCSIGDGYGPLLVAREPLDPAAIASKTVAVPGTLTSAFLALKLFAPGVKTQDLNNLFGALDKAIPGLGKIVKQNAGTGVAVTLNSIGAEATLEGRKARSFPLRFKDGAVMFGPVKVAQVPPLF